MKSNWTGKHGPLLIAEIGGNHEGNFDYAKELTAQAIESGADYVKFQLYTGDTLVSPVEGKVRNEHFKKFELTAQQHIFLAEMCKNAGVGYMASVWNEEFLTIVNDYIDIYKVGSGDLTAYPLLAKIAQLRKPIILSTGLAVEREVIETVEFIRKQNSFYKSNDNIALLQCTSMYPIAFANANLAVMERLQHVTGLSAGYSDHTEGSLALEIAYAMGASILEFHFTDSRKGKEFRDHKVSLTKEEVKDLCKRISLINELKGDPNKRPLDIEGEHLVSFRRAVYMKRDMLEGEIVNEEDLVFLRPNHGIDARDYQKLIGKKTLNDINAYCKLSLDEFE